MSYGYGLSASLFQIAHAYTVFARDGELIPVSLMKNPQPDGVTNGIRVVWRSPRLGAPHETGACCERWRGCCCSHCSKQRAG